ncbi:MAG: hypothetical protein CL953_06485 [Erythrobacteraceae bacterium]|nr:hypothetical protein [Erythrobacteraceae bacterium]
MAVGTLLAGLAMPAGAQQLDKWWKVKYYESYRTFDYYPILLRVDSGRAKHKAGNTLTPVDVAQLQNQSSEAVCAAFYFKAVREGYSNDVFERGNGAVYYIKARKTQKVAATLYSRSGRAQNFGFGTMVVHSWQPSGKNKCSADPAGRPDLS